MNGFRQLRKRATEQSERLHRYACGVFDQVWANAELLVPSALVLLLLAILTANETLGRYVKKSTLSASPISAFSQTSYPLIKQAILGARLDGIFAKAFLVVDDESKTILFSKHERLRLPTASTAKLATALVALEHFKMDDVLTVHRDKVEGANVGFKRGEQFLFEDLLYALLLPSGNDAALAIAQNYEGGEKAFVRKMNEKAFVLRLLDTSFSDPAGLVDAGDYTTAFDLAQLSSVALKHPVVSRIVSTRARTITTADGVKTYKLENLNKLLGTGRVTGIKTGFTDGAGGVLATSLIEEGRTFIIVVMRSSDRFLDTETLMELIRENVTFVSTHR